MERIIERRIEDASFTFLFPLFSSVLKQMEKRRCSAHPLLFLRGDPIGASRANRISEKKRKKKEEHLQKRNPPSLILEFQPRDSNRFLSPMGIEYTTDPFLILIADDDKFADLQHFEQNSSIMCTVKVT